jgi:hypothetical protein
MNIYDFPYKNLILARELEKSITDSALNTYFAYVQPFSYRVAVCKKLHADLV